MGLKACLCCGHRTLERPPGSSWQLCPVCCFDDPGATGPELALAQSHYAARGACDPELVELTQAPQDTPVPWHLPIAQERAVLVPMLFAAFGDQDLAGGVSLQEAEHIDDYRMPARTLKDPPAPGFGQSGPWHALGAAELEAFSWCNFSFQDARGLRYHIPAYIRAFLETPEMGVDPGSLLFCLASGWQLPALRTLLTAAQRHVIARWLVTQAVPEQGWDEGSARKALQRHWAQDLDPAHAENLAGLIG